MNFSFSIVKHLANGNVAGHHCKTLNTFFSNRERETVAIKAYDEYLPCHGHVSKQAGIDCSIISRSIVSNRLTSKLRFCLDFLLLLFIPT